MDRWQRIEELYEGAAALHGGEREAFLLRGCGDDAALRAELEGMLAAERPLSVERLAPAEGSVPDPLVGALVGRWRVVELLGRGGMGTVYLAERADGEYQQRAALKLVSAAAWGGPGAAERFRTERQVLARLQHPNIARLLDGGFAGDGRPYLVMELVDGLPITEHCRARGLSVEERLRLFRVVCQAVQHAHGALVVHRDLKPANTLVSEDGEVKLLDFGVAKLLDPAAFGIDAPETRELSAPLTPGYAAPEQLLGAPVTTATDVYSLGVLLHELLTGKRPGAAPSRLAGRRDDLDSIIQRALRAEPERRYVSAGQLGEEIDRYLAGQPVLARPDTLAYRARRFVGRNRAAVLGAALAAVALAAFGVLAASQARRAAAERDHARVERDKAEKLVGLLVELFEASNPSAQPEGDRMSVREFLAQAQPRVLERLAAQPEVRARLQQVFGMIHAARDQYAEARAVLEEALAAQRRLLGADHPEAIESLYQLGVLLKHTGEAARAEELLREALERSLRAHGELHERTARCLAALAAPERLDEAGDLLRRALAIRRRVLPADHPDLAESLGMLAYWHLLRGERARAEALYLEAVALFPTPASRRHPRAIVVLNDFANLLGSLGRDAEATVVLRESLELSRAVFGEGSFQVANRLNNLGVQLARAGQLEEAEQTFRESHAVHLELLGESHAATANVARNVGTALTLRGRHEEGLRWMDRALAPLAAERPPSYFHMAGRRASILVRLGRGEEALRAVAEAAADLQARGADGPRQAQIDVDGFHAQILVETGRPADAVPLARRAAAGVADLAYDHPRRANAECLLGWSLLESGAGAEGRATLARCLAPFRAYGLTDRVVVAAIERALQRGR
jgi:serine/threonine-protein kinase